MATIEVGDWLIADDRMARLAARVGGLERAVGLVVRLWLARPQGTSEASWCLVLGARAEDVRALREAGFLDGSWSVVDERPFRRRRKQAESQRRKRATANPAPAPEPQPEPERAEEPSPEPAAIEPGDFWDLEEALDHSQDF